jgi:tetratricopeptide (TPR) repeat protein
MPDSGKSKYQAPQPPVALDREEHESPHPALAGQDARTLAAPSQHWSDLAPNGSTSGSMSIAASAAPRDKAVDDARRREAYESFLRGRHEWQTLERHRMQDALQFLARALELDPFLVAARVDLARLSVTQAACGFVPASVAAATVHRTAGSLPEFAGQSESLLPLLGTICFHVDHDLPAAIAAFSRSAHLPYDTWNMRERAMFALSRRRFPEGIALLEEAIHQDPFSPWLHARLAWAFHLAGEPARSVQQIHRGLSTFPNHECMALYGAMILPFNGDAASGVRLAESLTARRPYFDLGAALHAYALACAGRRQQALAIVERLQWLSRQRFVSSSFNPAVHVALGDHDAAIADLCTAEHARCPWFFQMLADPRLAPLHGHPEFERLQAILPRMEAALAV